MNKNRAPYRFFAIAMALLMLLTSISFIADMHFCGNQLVTVNFFGTAPTCHEMIDAAPHCPNHQQMIAAHESCSVDGDDCCHNKSIQFEADQDRQVQIVSLDTNQPLLQFITAYVDVFCASTTNLVTGKPAYVQYKSPLISRDYAVLFQSFLI